MSGSDAVELVLVNRSSGDRGREGIEIPDHPGGEVKVQLPARDGARREGVGRAARNEHEGAGPADDLFVSEEHHVLALEDVERLRTVVVDVHRRAEPWRLARLQDREDARGLVLIRLHDDGETLTDVDPASFVRAYRNRANVRHAPTLTAPRAAVNALAVAKPATLAQRLLLHDRLRCRRRCRRRGARAELLRPEHGADRSLEGLIREVPDTQLLEPRRQDVLAVARRVEPRVHDRPRGPERPRAPGDVLADLECRRPGGVRRED